MKDKLLKLITYSLWANTKVFKTLIDENITDDKMIFWAGHILNAQEIWMDRIENKVVAISPMEMRDKDKLLLDLESLNTRFHNLVDSTKEEELGNVIHYKNSKGTPFESILSDILFHLINHDTHHRSQIAARLREQGYIPPTTDYIFFVR
ncbi:MAG: DinB family protein [Bacteroidota bacterium]